MQERPQNLEDVGTDPEATLVAPRFDAEEARRAHPVVPLSGTDVSTPFVEAHGRTRYVDAPAWPRRGLRRSWPTALLAVVLLAAVAAGGVVATKVLRRPQPNTPAQTEAVPTQTEAAPAPPTTNDAPQTQEASPAAQAPREEAREKRPSRTPRGREAEGAMMTAPAEIPRGAAGESDDKDDEHRGKDIGKRRERGDDEAEKRMRKAQKHSKSKGPRLVDVLTGP